MYRYMKKGASDLLRCEYCCISYSVYDIEICVGVEELKRALRIINASGWTIVSMTQNEEIYTILFQRPASN